MRMHGWWWPLGLACLLAAGAAAQSSSTKPKTSAPAAKTSSTKPSSSKSGSTKSASSKTAASKTGPVATVGGMQITRAAFDERVRTAEENYRDRAGAAPSAEDLPVLKRQVLEGLIREKLLLLEAKRRGMTITAAQAEEEVKKDPFFQTGGMFDEAKFLAIKSGQPERFKAVVADVQNTIPAIRLREKIMRENAPDSAAIRARLSSELSTVRLHYLALRRAEFEGEVAPPTEAEVIGYYREHANDFKRPEEVSVSVLTVNQPPLAANQQTNEAARKSWEARMEKQADSLLTALKKGAPLEGVAPLYGGLKSEILQKDRFPRYWLATGRSREDVFNTPEGALMPNPIPAADGRIIVRVDDHRPAGVAPLRDVAVDIRRTLALSKAEAAEDKELRALYPAMKDSLRGEGFKVRYAVADTATFPVPEPSQAELDRYYRGHQADYATLDRATTSIVTQPFSQVKGDVRNRLMQERRIQATRDAAAQLLQTWSAGKRDQKLERTMNAKDVGPIPKGGAVDKGPVGEMLTDSLAARHASDSGILPSERGPVVYFVHDRVKDFVPSYEASRPVLEAKRQARLAKKEEADAHALFDAEPKLFSGGNVIRFSRLMVSPPAVFDVPLTRQEVESWYRNHTEKYGAPELVRVRHIVIVPQGTNSAADEAAHKVADEVMAKLKAGEDFATLALRYSDDDETKAQGGDVGVIRPGLMLPDFDRLAFSMDPGERRGPVRISAGYEIMECLEHQPAEMVPLKYCYANVAVDAARSKGRLIARFRADSLLRTFKSVPQARAAAKKTGFSLYQNDHVTGTMMPKDLSDYIHRIERTPAGKIYPEIQEYIGMGYAVSWVDSVLPPRPPKWLEARDQAVSALHDKTTRERMMVKRAELDSMLHVGWSFDSVAALRGGPEEHGPSGPGKQLPKLGGAEMLDSLAFGSKNKPPVLQPLVLSDWIEMPGGFVRMRLMERHPPDPSVLTTRFENDYRSQMELNFRKEFDKMRRTFPVQILDPELRVVDLPTLETS
jgi:parvulin-like peptidyl-prolyl isomerase